MTEFHAVIDRIEGTMAVLILGMEQHQVVAPRELLPKDAGEGAVLKINIDVDFAATEDARRRVHNLIDQVSTGDG